MDDREAESLPGQMHFGLTDTGFSTHFMEIRIFQSLPLNLFVNVTQSSFHNTAGISKDHARAGFEPERHIQRFRF